MTTLTVTVSYQNKVKLERAVLKKAVNVLGVKAGMLAENKDDVVVAAAAAVDAVGAFSRPPSTESPARYNINLT